MTPEDCSRYADDLLSLIERAELPSLQWGYVDGSLSLQEVKNFSRQAIESESISDDDAEDLIENLIRSSMLIELQSGSSQRYRSRFAETVRLARNLRQWFHGKSWTSAPGLISDYRVDARPRRFPRRDIPLESVVQELGDSSEISEFRVELLSAMLGRGDDGRKLSQFQLDTAKALLRDSEQSRGVIVSAGTGTGKTLAFYLPALLEIADWTEKNDNWVKAIALYPRVELLKDQFSEAFRLIRSTDEVLKAHGKRAITIGTFFGSTPSAPTEQAVRSSGWKESGPGYLCPYLACPECGSPMSWLKNDLAQGTQRLTCTNRRCEGVATSDQISLVRDRSGNQAPDILFTTSESLNSRISDLGARHNFGLHKNRSKRVRLILLDEVHTYTGISGAHVALLLRRWQWALNSPVRVVGLSATLESPIDFFSQFTGLDETRIEQVIPEERDMESASMEYQLILRANPASRASLLSATIQTTFLMARALDQMPSENVEGDTGKTGGRLGSRLFVFTDDLDTINRLYDDLRNAEGVVYAGGDGKERLPLAQLRSQNNSQPGQRDQYGQNWAALESFGSQLSSPLRITRTTSQDAGVDTSSQVIVASASLDVGFDDPNVGGILQHKSAYSLATFAQRKGRAGRSQNMRPWMVTVLSDYGRDRLAYQSYEQYLDIVIPPQTLPVRNRYLLRMQMVYAFMDWLARDVSGNLSGWWWQALDGPDGNPTIKRLQGILSTVIRDLLSGGEKYGDSLRRYLRGSLGRLGSDEVETLLWDAPRPLLLEVLPTLERRLNTRWEVHPALKPEMSRDVMRTAGFHPKPLPDYVPAALFSDLDLPEVTIELSGPRGRANNDNALPIVQALRTFAPGRISRRFAYGWASQQHWVPIQRVPGRQILDLDNYSSGAEWVAMVRAGAADGPAGDVPCYRPWTIQAEEVSPTEVRASSNSFLRWQTNLLTTGTPVRIPGPSSSRWGGLIENIDFHLNRLRSPIISRRFATGADANLRLQNRRDEIEIEVEFEKHGSPAAIGFEQEVDGFVVRLKLPTIEELANRINSSPNLPAWKTAYFIDLVRNDPQLVKLTNVFQRDWLSEIYLSALIEVSARIGTDLEQAQTTLLEGDLRERLTLVMAAVFQANADHPEENQVETLGEEEAEEHASRLQETILALLDNPDVADRLHALAAELWNADGIMWYRWIRTRLHETVGEAVIEAAIRIAPLHTTPESLLIDLDHGLRQDSEGKAEETLIWITEATLGGTGAVEAISQSVVADPARFMEAIEAAIAPGDLEVVASDLTDFTRLVRSDGEVRAALSEMRLDDGYLVREKARLRLHSLLADRGLGMSRTLSIALNYRMLRVGSDDETDEFVADVIDLWETTEKSLGVSIDLRVFSYLVVVHSKLGQRVTQMIKKVTGQVTDQADSVGVLSGILWQRPAEVRRHSLNSYNPFTKQGYTDPSLFRDLISFGDIEEVSVAEDDWQQKYMEILRESGFVTLIAPTSDRQSLLDTVFDLIAQPVDVGYLQFYPVLRGFEKREGSTAATFAIPEME